LVSSLRKVIRSMEKNQRLTNAVKFWNTLTVAVLSLLEATEGHLGARDVLLGVLEVLEQSVLVPVHSALLVGVGVGEALDLTRLAAEDTVELRADLVALAGLQSVALSAAGLEKVGALLVVTWDAYVSLCSAAVMRSERHEAATSGSRRHGWCWPTTLMNAGWWSPLVSHCALSRCALIAALVPWDAPEVEKASLPGAKLSLPIVIDVIGSWELFVWWYVWSVGEKWMSVWMEMCRW
jgi:hypothetical protein